MLTHIPKLERAGMRVLFEVETDFTDIFYLIYYLQMQDRFHPVGVDMQDTLGKGREGVKLGLSIHHTVIGVLSADADVNILGLPFLSTA